MATCGVLKPAATAALLVALLAAGCASPGPLATLPEPEWKVRMERILDERVSGDFIATPLDDVVAYLRNLKKVNIIVDSTAVRNRDNLDVTIRLEKVKLRTMLKWTLALLDLTYVVENGAIVITSPRLIETYREQQRPLGDRLHDPVSLEFADATLEQVLAFFAKSLGPCRSALVVDPIAAAAAKGKTVTLKLKDVRLGDGLRQALAPLELDTVVEEDAVVISSAERRRANRLARELLRAPEAEKDIAAALAEPVSFDFIATPLADVLAFLRNLKKIDIVVDQRTVPRLGDLDITLKLEKVPLRDALDWVLRLCDLGYDVRDGVVFVSTKQGLQEHELARPVVYDAAEWKALDALMERRISFDFIATPMPDVVAFLRNWTKSNIVLDRRDLPRRTVTLKVKKMKLKTALGWACQQVGAAYTVKDGLIYIAAPVRAAAMAK